MGYSYYALTENVDKLVIIMLPLSETNNEKFTKRYILDKRYIIIGTTLYGIREGKIVSVGESKFCKLKCEVIDDIAVINNASVEKLREIAELYNERCKHDKIKIDKVIVDCDASPQEPFLACDDDNIVEVINNKSNVNEVVRKEEDIRNLILVNAIYTNVLKDRDGKIYRYIGNALILDDSYYLDRVSGLVYNINDKLNEIGVVSLNWDEIDVLHKERRKVDEAPILKGIKFINDIYLKVDKKIYRYFKIYDEFAVPSVSHNTFDKFEFMIDNYIKYYIGTILVNDFCIENDMYLYDIKNGLLCAYVIEVNEYSNIYQANFEKKVKDVVNSITGDEDDTPRASMLDDTSISYKNEIYDIEPDVYVTSIFKETLGYKDLTEVADYLYDGVKRIARKRESDAAQTEKKKKKIFGIF